jgi:methyl-accepting chemotaxis protein
VGPASNRDGAMTRLSSFRITTKLGVAMALPLAVLLAVVGYVLLDKWQERAEMIRLGRMAAGVADVARLIHELQRERGASAVFLGGHGAQMRDELSEQRKQVNARRLPAATFLMQQRMRTTNETYRSVIITAEQAIDALFTKRRLIDSFEMTPGQSFIYFRDVIAALLAVAGESAKASRHGEVATALAAYAAFMQGKEKAGQERGMGAAGVAAGKFRRADYLAVTGLDVAQEAFFAVFEAAASPTQRMIFRQIVSGPAVDDVMRMRTIIADGGMTGEMQGLDGKTWFEATSGRIDLLKQVAERIAADIEVLTTRIAAEATRSVSVLVGAVLTILLLCIAIVIPVSRDIAGSIRSLTRGMRELASGNFNIVLPGLGRKDEVGAIAGAVYAFKMKLEDSMREEARKDAEAGRIIAEVVAELGRALDNLARGNLTYRVNGSFATEYRKIRDDFNAAIGRLQDTVQRIAVSSTEISNAAAEISTATNDLSRRTEEQAASLEQTSASMEQIAATVKKNAESAQRADALTRDTRSVAFRGESVVAEAVSAMAQIEQSSRRISDIVSVIDEIARQTNLLALNATVEAARAGESGRGFSVVAAEVRSLAQRSSQASKDIKRLIASASSQVHGGVQLVNRAGDSLKEILTSVRAVADIVSDIAQASAEQSSGVEQINRALLQMDQATQQNSALVEQNAATAKMLADQSVALDGRVAAFQLAHGQGVARRSRAPVAAVSASVNARANAKEVWEQF